MDYRRAKQILKKNKEIADHPTKFEKTIEVQIETEGKKHWVFASIIEENSDKTFHCYFYYGGDGWDDFFPSEMREDHA